MSQSEGRGKEWRNNESINSWPAFQRRWMHSKNNALYNQIYFISSYKTTSQINMILLEQSFSIYITGSTKIMLSAIFNFIERNQTAV